MNLDELTFFEAQVMLCKSSKKSIDDKSCLIFILSQLELANTQLKNLNLKKTATLLGELYNQPIKSNHQQIRQKITDNLPFLLLTKEYKNGKTRGKVCAERGRYPGPNIITHSSDYISGYEESYTINLLDSTQSNKEKGKRLGVLAQRLKKQRLEEMDFIQYSYNSQIRNNPEFLSGFEQGLKNKKKKIHNSLGSESDIISEQHNGQDNGTRCFKRGSFPGDIGEHTPYYLNSYEKGYTISLLNSEEPFQMKGLKLGALASRLGKKEVKELQFIDENNQILHDPVFLYFFKKGLNLSCNNKIRKQQVASLLSSNVAGTMNNTTGNVSTTSWSGQENYSPVFTPHQESPVTLVQHSSPVHSSLENDNTGDNFSSLETFLLTPDPANYQQNDQEINNVQQLNHVLDSLGTHNQNEQTTPNTDTNSDCMAGSAPQFNYQDLEDNLLNHPVLPTDSTHIATFVAENPYHFFQNQPPSGPNPFAEAQGQTKKRKITPY